uniref:Uncharacterized protein n=1 Tax=Peronospora matthiolae TaxID=2874970 RepID=A0AAV1VP94_9STRA
MRVSYYSYLSALAVICLFAYGDSFAVEGVEILKSDQAKQDTSGHKSLRGFLFYDMFSSKKDSGRKDGGVVRWTVCVHKVRYANKHTHPMRSSSYPVLQGLLRSTSTPGCTCLS